jgi:hypothetical protein
MSILLVCWCWDGNLRNRPFNLKGGYGFLFRSEYFFSDNTRVRPVQHHYLNLISTIIFNQPLLTTYFLPTTTSNLLLQTKTCLLYQQQILMTNTVTLGTGHLTWRGGGGRLWFFVSFRIFFPDNTRVRIFFFPEIHISLWQKLWIRLFFFFLH